MFSYDATTQHIVPKGVAELEEDLIEMISPLIFGLTPETPQPKRYKMSW